MFETILQMSWISRFIKHTTCTCESVNDSVHKTWYVRKRNVRIFRISMELNVHNWKQLSCHETIVIMIWNLTLQYLKELCCIPKQLKKPQFYPKYIYLCIFILILRNANDWKNCGYDVSNHLSYKRIRYTYYWASSCVLLFDAFLGRTNSNC